MIPIVVLALFRAPLWLFAVLVLGVALLAAREYFDIAEKTGFRPTRGWGYFSILAIFAALYGAVVAARTPYFPYFSYGGFTLLFTQAVTFVLIISPMVFMALALRRETLSHSLADAAISFLAIPYIALTLLLLVMLRESDFGALFLLYLMLLVWCGDVAAYYVGRAVGRHKLAPRVSPGKTWEGAIASVAGATLIGVVLFHYINPIASAFVNAHLQMSPSGRSTTSTPQFQLAPVWFVAMFAICVNVAAQLGDLVESALKRGAGMKDSGNLLPGHGGVLDRIDALLFALPVGLFFYAFGMSRYFESVGGR